MIKQLIPFNILNYLLKLNLSIDSRELRGLAKVTISNRSNYPLSRVTFLLNRGLKPAEVSGEVVSSWRVFRASLSDLSDFIVNTIEVSFSKSLGMGSTIELVISYEGSIRDYSNVLSYVKDHIGDYTLIRLDALSYPILTTGLSLKDLITSVINQCFTYRIEVTVPKGYVVANVGRLVDHVVRDSNESYVYVSKVPSWRIDVAVSRFKVLKDGREDLRVFYLLEDEGYAPKVLNALRECLKFFREVLGDPPRWCGFTIIELPEGYGSQADYVGILLQRSDFIDPKHLGIYHELAHLWNAKTAEYPPSRFFDEGFASYFQLLAERRFLGEEWFRRRLSKLVERLRGLIRERPELLKVPIANYGRYGLTDASYYVGSLLLHILHELLGDEGFFKTIRKFLREHYEKPATLDDFITAFTNRYGSSVEELIREWLYTTKPLKELMSKDLRELIEEYLSRIEKSFKGPHQ